jgi:hypothetical protein
MRNCEQPKDNTACRDNAEAGLDFWLPRNHTPIHFSSPHVRELAGGLLPPRAVPPRALLFLDFFLLHSFGRTSNGLGNATKGRVIATLAGSVNVFGHRRFASLASRERPS